MTKTPAIRFEDFRTSDLAACLQLFDSNCPAFFAPVERDGYEQFLSSGPDGYEVGLLERGVVGAYGLSADEPGIGQLRWILVDPESQGLGVGSAMMRRVVDRARSSQLQEVHIAASHRSEPFFQRFGAITVSKSEDGWGVGMHRHDMVLDL